MKILFKNARILTMKDENIILANLVVKDNRIVYIGKDYSEYAPFDREIECNGNLLMPGFKNAHAHSAMVFLRGKADDVPLQEWLFDVVFPHEANLQPTDVYYLNKVAYLEYLTSGITAVFDHYFYPSDMARASEEFGMRSTFLVMPDETKYPMQYISDVYHKYNDNKDSLVRVRIGFHAEYTADDATFEDVSSSSVPSSSGVESSSSLSSSSEGVDKSLWNPAKHKVRVNTAFYSDSVWADGVEASGYWYVNSDQGGESKVIWPVADYAGGDLGAVMDTCGGICGTASLVKGEQEQDPMVTINVGIALDSALDVVPVDVSNWGGVCVEYRSETDMKLELDLGDSVNTALGGLAGVNMPASEEPIPLARSASQPA